MSLKTYLLKARVKWCKILGEAPPGYDNGPAEWTLDAILDEQGVADYVASGGDPFYVRDSKDGERFIKFTRKAIKKDGEKAQSIRVLDHRGEVWDQNKLIGNDSVVNIQYSLNEVNSKGKKRLKPSVLAVQVWDWKQYQSKSAFPTRDEPLNESPVTSETSDTPAWDEK